MESEVKEKCPVCGADSDLEFKPYNIPYFGDIMLFVSTCRSCGYHSSDVMILSGDKSKKRHELHVSSGEDLSAMVVRSSSGRIEIPELGVNVEPRRGESFITTVEGVLARVEGIVKMLRTEVEGAKRERADYILKYIEGIKAGEKGMTLIIEDPTGNSAIIPRQVDEILRRKKRRTELLKVRRSMRRAIVAAVEAGRRPVIGELKRKGLTGQGIEIDAAVAASRIEAGGACAVSVLTDEAFDGSLSDLEAVKLAVSLPVLRKDFIFDEFQVMESYVHGADAILLIMRFLNERQMIELVNKARSFGMECIVEIDSVSRAKLPDLSEVADSVIVGINNRDLVTLDVRLETFEAIAPAVKSRLPAGVPLVAMSGIASKDDALRMFNAGADAILVGTSIMHAPDIKSKVRELCDSSYS